MGYEVPSAIQRKAILPILEGRDLIAQAQSGTGKTATFLIGAMGRVDREQNVPQVVILCHNRELAAQIHFNFEGLNTYLKLKGGLFIGGSPLDADIETVEKGVQFIIGTPGRILDLMHQTPRKDAGGNGRHGGRSRGAFDSRRSSNTRLSLETVKLIVLDEADELLSSGFQRQLYMLFQSDLPVDSQVCIFSATMPPSALELTAKFMKNPVEILVKDEEITLEGIKQYYVLLKYENWKPDTLIDLYKNLIINQTIIFVNTVKGAEELKKILLENQFDVACIHRNMTQLDRNKIMKDFRTGKSRVLIATDMIARGIDVQQVSIVINYDLPLHEETYIHRIGRSGRYGRKGTAINFVVQNEQRFVRDLERFYRTNIKQLPENISDLL